MASLERESFGSLGDGREVERFTLTNVHGLAAQVMTYGAILTSFKMPDRNGVLDEVTLGFDRFEDYLGPHPFFGATVGRVANRIADGRFTLDGVEYQVPKVDPSQAWAIHGGVKGFDKVLWEGAEIQREGERGVVLSYRSRDGEEGFPGNLLVTVTYLLDDDDALWMQFEATTDKPTPVNLTNHAYWNLAGAGRASVLDHELQIDADHYLATDDRTVITGEVAPAAGTALDFTGTHRIGERMGSAPGGLGYDHCFVLRDAQMRRRKRAEGSSGSGGLAHTATVREHGSGRVMTVETTQPCVQLYAAIFLRHTVGAGGRTFEQFGGLCLETQGYTDAVNQPRFPSIILRPGQTYRQSTVHRFFIQSEA